MSSPTIKAVLIVKGDKDVRETIPLLKVNDAGYYATWLEYFDSLCLHNTLFYNTAYSLEYFTLLPEDMHDENVLVQEDALFFIDTVFYIDRP